MSQTGLAGLLSTATPGSAPGSLTLHEAAVWAGRARWVELEVFARVGRRAARLEPAPVAVWADGASLAAAWRASLLAELLPVSVGLPEPSELTCSAGPGVELVLDRLGPPVEEEDLSALLNPATGAAPGSGGDPPRPVALAATADGPGLARHMAVDFYPALLAAYEARRAAASPAADGPLVRVIARVTGDLTAEVEAAARVAEGACRPA